MRQVSASDLQAVLGFVREAAAETGPDPFPAHLVERLRILVGAEWGSYCELDRPRREVRALVESPVNESGIADEVFWRIVVQHPLCRAQAQGRFDALKLSDFYSLRELHGRPLYEDWFRPAGVEYELEVAIPSPPEHTKTFLFDGARRDFGERERSLLNLLAPHFEQLYRAAALRRLAETARAVLQDGRRLDGQGVVVLGASGSIEMAGEAARRLLSDYFADGTPTRLPPELLGWLDAQRAAARAGLVRAPFRQPGASGTLVVELDPRAGLDVLLLEEHAARAGDPAALTRREREVLALVSEGMRNAEIAETLWLSPATVRKHLENIYEKLGVHTRTAAVARAKGIAQAM